jgi:hypothetical protein
MRKAYETESLVYLCPEQRLQPGRQRLFRSVSVCQAFCFYLETWDSPGLRIIARSVKICFVFTQDAPDGIFPLEAALENLKLRPGKFRELAFVIDNAGVLPAGGRRRGCFNCRRFLDG